MPFATATTKFCIGSLDDVGIEVEAQYNPKELQFDQTMGWNEAGRVRQNQPKGGPIEFTGTQASTVKVELLFDGAENHGLLHSHSSSALSVMAQIDKLTKLAHATSPKKRNEKPGTATAQNPKDLRPHFCIATWGAGENKVPRFECIIESMSVKYTMFANDGTVLRASVTLSLKSQARPDPKSGLELSREDLERDQRRLVRIAENANADRARAWVEGGGRPASQPARSSTAAQEMHTRAAQNRRGADAVDQVEAGNAQERAAASRKLRESAARDERGAEVIDDLE